MSLVAEFQAGIDKRSIGGTAAWFPVDLHNHSPGSFDYRDKGTDAKDRIIQRLIGMTPKPLVVMFTDHEVLPGEDFCAEIARNAGLIVLRGVELNCFVDAYDTGSGNVGRNLFYHLLIGFDPANSHPPDYWLEEIYRECHAEHRSVGTREARGIRATPTDLHKVLAEANAIVIPAHLHSQRNAWKSRSIDDIYQDQEFLRDVNHHFTAIEVTNQRTAAFFDGHHAETNNMRASVIWSSDSHAPDSLGTRMSYLLMEQPSFAEVKAALELPFRTSLTLPPQPSSHIIGVHVQGGFLPDTWVRFAPGCNVLIGSKGSGKTSILECLRFALGTPVPESKRDSVRSHLNAILGASGRIRVLVRRADGALCIIERGVSDSIFTVVFDDDRREVFSHPDALRVPTQILGWHEIEQISTDVTIRRQYMDAIAGADAVASLRDQIVALTHGAQEKHNQVASRYGQYRSLDAQISRLDELRRGLQHLSDNNLIQLRDQYARAVELREVFRKLLSRVQETPARFAEAVREHRERLSPTQPGTETPLDGCLAEINGLLRRVNDRLATTEVTVRACVDEVVPAWEDALARSETAFAAFVQSYDQRASTLTPQQRQLLETHRDVLEQTKQLSDLITQRQAIEAAMRTDLSFLEQTCGRIVELLKQRTAIRVRAVDNLNLQVATLDVRLQVSAHSIARAFEELSNSFRGGFDQFNQLRSRLSGFTLTHERLKDAYSKLEKTLSAGGAKEWGDLLFGQGEFSHYIGRFEDDDLQIELKVGGTFRPIGQLSAGQKCTAIFPVLLEMSTAPLIVDQPEDNLDNRYIASLVAPAIRHRKQGRQLVFTSHNANLVVLSDPELIVAMDSDGTVGRIEEAGFLACATSHITKHVLEVVDGGEEALKQRHRKYGTARWS